MNFYERNPSDPAWLARAGEFHGHLGPWVTVGAMIGRDALRRLEVPGHWTIEVVCWMPPEKQRTPYSCILDGLQATSGATMGKRNIRFDFSPEVAGAGQPVVYVIRRGDKDQPSEGLVYQLKGTPVAIMANGSPDRLEAVSRDIAGRDIDELFAVRPLSEDELARTPSRQ